MCEDVISDLYHSDKNYHFSTFFDRTYMSGLTLFIHTIHMICVKKFELQGGLKLGLLGALKYFSSIALISHNTLKLSAILGLSFLHGAGGSGNLCYGVQAHLVNFALHFQKC